MFNQRSDAQALQAFGLLWTGEAILTLHQALHVRKRCRHDVVKHVVNVQSEHALTRAVHVYPMNVCQAAILRKGNSQSKQGGNRTVDQMEKRFLTGLKIDIGMIAARSTG